jgi:hypothetical protein
LRSRSSRRGHPHFRRRRYLAVIEHHRSAANDNVIERCKAKAGHPQMSQITQIRMEVPLSEAVNQDLRPSASSVASRFYSYCHAQ